MSCFYPVTGVVVHSGFPIVSQKYTLNIERGMDAYTYFNVYTALLQDEAYYYNSTSVHSSVQQPLLILNQSHGWGRGLTQQ